MDETTAIYKAQQGDLAAFNQLVMAYQGTAYNVAYRVMGNSETAADACQDAFLKAYKSIKQYEGGSFKSWLFRIVTNTCYDHLRYKKRRPATSLDDMTDNPDEHNTHLVSDSEAPEDRVLRGELNDLIQLGINQLPEDQRLVLVLSDVQGMAYQEIAEIIDQPLGTVKSRLSRGRRRLRDFLLEQKELLPGQYRLNS
ncbi:MAG: sigma-70 family RNA polymerase sigma factor [Anaerolineaceae bacterium]|nr:sigma-70 family RNA polymerase sigma factor [Anaerolineaceae bacterium]MCB9100526.1 sigma-70 family RNA polymerase sigma factor [Anaerolineales bacterium]